MDQVSRVAFVTASSNLARYYSINQHEDAPVNDELRTVFRLSREINGIVYQYDVIASDKETAENMLDQRERDIAGRYDFISMLDEFPYLKDIICVPHAAVSR
jgi:hypothetical protein